MNIENLYPFIYAMIAGAGYAVVWWQAKRIDPTKPTPKFDKISFLVTLCFGAGIGVVNVWSGNPLTQMSMETQLMAYGTQIALAREVLTTAYNYIQEWRKNKKG